MDNSMEKQGSDTDDEDNINNDDMLRDLFSSPYYLECAAHVASKDAYVLHMDGSRVSRTKVAIGLSDPICAVYDINTLKKLENLCGHKRPVSNVRFSPNDDSLVYSSSYDGTIKVWDLRLQSKCVKEFKDDSEGPTNLKPLSDFDISCNANFLSAGTELIDEDAFILFWDIRSAKLLGGYWESHMELITQVKFHPQKQEVLATGSTDGLINIFDISKSSEEKALLHTLNTQSSVEKINWLNMHGNDDDLSCITQQQDLQLWNCDGASPFVQFDRYSISDFSQMRSAVDCYLVDVHRTNKSDEFLLLAGNKSKRNCLRTLKGHKKKLKPMSDFIGKKQYVRASWYDKNSEVLITGGESGILAVWKPQTHAENENVSDLKMESKKKNKCHRKKPY